MEDVAPELYNEIQKIYKEAARSDKKLVGLMQKIKSGKGTQADVTTIAERLGRHASDAMKKVLTVDKLPDGKMYWNIAEKTIKPTLMNVHQVVNGVASLEMRAEDIKRGLKVAVQVGQDPTWRINEVMNFAANSASGTELANALTEPVKTTALDFYDDFQMKNADVRHGVGLTQYVVREYDGVGLRSGACNWCLERAGTWSYQDAKDNGVFERHPGCGCTIEVVYDDDLSDEAEYGSTPF